MDQNGSTSSCSRWNPTRDQIAILESLYMQGIRTPTAEQIQQITTRLREFGLTEGKNVFYWFQNHKARQRQKLKQEKIFARRLLRTGTVPSPVAAQARPQQPSLGLQHPQGCCSNIDCGPYCTPVPQAGAGYYPNVFMTESLQMSPIQTLLQMPELHSADQQQQQQQRNIDLHEFSHNNVNGCSPLSIETLQLFPLHPTGIINEADRSAGSSLTSVSVESDDHSLEGEEVGGENSKPPHFFSFFG